MHGCRARPSWLVVCMALSAARLDLLDVSGSVCEYSADDKLLRTFQRPDNAIKLVGLAVQAAAIVTEVDILLIVLLNKQHTGFGMFYAACTSVLRRWPQRLPYLRIHLQQECSPPLVHPLVEALAWYLYQHDRFERLVHLLSSHVLAAVVTRWQLCCLARKHKSMITHANN